MMKKLMTIDTRAMITLVLAALTSLTIVADVVAVVVHAISV